MSVQWLPGDGSSIQCSTARNNVFQTALLKKKGFLITSWANWIITGKYVYAMVATRL